MYHFQVQKMTHMQIWMISSIQIIWKWQTSRRRHLRYANQQSPHHFWLWSVACGKSEVKLFAFKEITNRWKFSFSKGEKWFDKLFNVKYLPLFHHFKAIYQFPKHIIFWVKFVANAPLNINPRTFFCYCANQKFTSLIKPKWNEKQNKKWHFRNSSKFQ
jgi:hypothetical protein